MACRPYNTGRCLLLRLFNPSKLWGSLQNRPRDYNCSATFLLFPDVLNMDSYSYFAKHILQSYKKGKRAKG